MRRLFRSSSRTKAQTLPPDQPDDAYDILGESWLKAGPKDGHEREDYQVEVPTESPFVTAMRKARGGPYILAPDSADWVPPTSSPRRTQKRSRKPRGVRTRSSTTNGFRRARSRSRVRKTPT